MPSRPLRLLLIDDRTHERFRMTLDELKVWARTVNKSRLASIRVQVEGRSEWQTLGEVGVRGISGATVEEVAPEEETTVIELFDRVQTPRRNMAADPRAREERRQKSAERRRSPRVLMRRRTIIVAGDVVYRTFTVDASVDGLRLEHPVPRELRGRTVDCYLSSQDLLTGVVFKAMLVEDGGESVRLRFLEQDPKNLSALGKWISSLAKKAA